MSFRSGVYNNSTAARLVHPLVGSPRVSKEELTSNPISLKKRDGLFHAVRPQLVLSRHQVTYRQSFARVAPTKQRRLSSSNAGPQQL